MAAHRTPFHVKRGPVVWISGLGAGSADALRTALAPWAVVRSVRILPPPKDTLPNTAVREADVEVSVCLVFVTTWLSLIQLILQTMREVQELLAHADHVVLGPPSSTPVSISLSPVDRTMRVELSQHIGRLDALTWESGKRRQVLDWTLSAAADEPDWAKRVSLDESHACEADTECWTRSWCRRSYRLLLPLFPFEQWANSLRWLV